MQLLTNRKEVFVLTNDVENNIIIFGCESNLLFLQQCQKVLMDGTFEFCTQFFTQFFTIHGMNNGHFIPLLFCLLPDKKKETYTNLFNLVKNLCNERNLFFRPQAFIVDFEDSIHRALNKLWSDIPIV